MARVPLSQRPDIPGSQLIQAPRATNLQGIDSGLLRANQNLANQFDNLVEIEGQIGALDQARDDKREVDTRIASSKLWQIQAKQEYNGLQGQERIENQPVYQDNYRKHIQDTANQIINPRAREVYLSNMQTQMAMGFADNSKSVTSARNHAEAEVKKLQAQLALTGVVNTDVSDVAAREIVVAELALTIKENYDLIGIPTDTKEGQALRAQGLNIAMSEATLTDVKQRLSQDPPDLEGAARLMADPMVQRTLTEAARSEISGLIANTGQIAAGQAVVERLMLDPKIAEDEGLMRDAIMKELEGKAQNEALRLNTANFAAKVRQNTMAERAVTSELMLALNENRKPNLTADQILLMKRRGLDKTVEADRIARINPEKLRPPTPDGEEAVYKLRRDPEKFMNENFHTPYWHGALGKTWAETVNLQLADIAKFENVNVKLSKEQAKLHKAGVDSDNIKSAIEGDPAYEKADANHQAEARQAAALAIDADLKANPNLKLNDIITGDYVRAALLGTLRKDNSFRTFMGIEKSIPLGTAILQGVTISAADNEGLKNAMWARVKRTKGLSRARVDQLIDIFIDGKQLPTPARLKEYHRRDTNQKRLNAAINRLNQVVTADFETIPQASETVPAPEEAPDSTAKAGPVTKKQADAEVAEVASASSEIVELTVQEETKAEADALEIIQALPEAAQTDQNIAAQITSTKARMLKKKQDAAKVPQRQAPFPPSERAALFREFDVPTEEDIAARKTALTATIAATRRVREKLAPQSQEKLDALASETELQRQRADNGGMTDAELKEFQKAPPIPKGKNLGSRGEERSLEQTIASTELAPDRKALAGAEAAITDFADTPAAANIASARQRFKKRGATLPAAQLDRLSTIIEHAESGAADNPQAITNKTTSATGFYQITNGTRQSAARRILKRDPNAPEWVKDAARKKSKSTHQAFIGNLNKKQQQSLMLANLIEKSGSDNLFVAWAKGGFSDKGLEDIYVKLHHTRDKPAIRKHIRASIKAAGAAGKSAGSVIAKATLRRKPKRTHSNLAFKTTKIQALMERSSTNPVIIPALQKAGAKLGIKLVITDGPRTVAQQKAIMRKMWKTNRKQYIKNYGDEPPETNTFTSKHLSSNAADLRIPPTFKKTKALREQFGKQVEDALGQGAQVHVEGNHLHVNFTSSGK